MNKKEFDEIMEKIWHLHEVHKIAEGLPPSGPNVAQTKEFCSETAKAMFAHIFPS